MHDPESYEKLKHSADNRNLAAEMFLPPILDKMKISQVRNQKILDFGCGTGLFAHTYLLPIAESTDSKIIGLDISEAMIEHAASKYSGERLAFVCGDILKEQSNLGNSEFDSIISFFVLHFIKDYK